VITKRRLIFYCLLFFTGKLQAQVPPQQWALHYGGSAVDIPFVIKFTADGGTVAAGYTDSQDGDVNNVAAREYWDLWVVKLDKCGTIQWQLTLGGTGYESARDIEQTSDGGFIVLGETNSTDGGVVAGYGGTKDIWLIKLNAAGTVDWQKRYGGSGLDIGNHIRIADDGGYLIAASSSSNDGDITGNHGTGYTDGVFMKISAAGAVVWSKCFGGSKNEELLDIEIINGTTFIAGYANSNDGDIPPSQKNYDVWLLALDANGNKIFSKVYGGSQNDVAYSMTTGTDGTLTLVGYTTSTDGDVKGAKGSQDYWVVNISTTGKLNWQKVLGGTDAEYANAVLTDKDGGYMVGGISYSTDGDITNPLGEGDYWVVKLSVAGDVVWKKNWGGSDNDYLRSLIYKPAGNEYYLCGDSESGDGDFNNSQGETDFAIIKLKEIDTLTQDSTVCSLANFVPFTDTLKDVCDYDSAIVTYKPVVLNKAFDNIRKSDTILVGQSVTLYSNGNGKVVWDANPTLSCTDCPNPVATPTETTRYTAVNSLETNCSIPDDFTVVVLKDALVLTPSGFTPNSDGLNDFFGPIGKVPEGYTMQIYNRDGNMIFKSTSIGNKWNGMYKGKLQQSGVYIYLINYKDLQNRPKMQKGTFVLIR
jgi:gliding motility-associated-like protein